MSDLYEYQAIDGSSKGPIALVLLLQARNQGRLSNQALVKKLPDGAWRPLSSYIPPMTVLDEDRDRAAEGEANCSRRVLVPHWSRKKHWRRVIREWCSFRGRAGKGEMREVYATLGPVWLAAACLPALEKYDFFSYPAPWMESVFLGLFYMVLSVLTIPLAATMVRRLHDVGRSGIWLVCLGLPRWDGCCCGICLTGRASWGRTGTGIPVELMCSRVIGACPWEKPSGSGTDSPERWIQGAGGNGSDLFQVKFIYGKSEHGRLLPFGDNLLLQVQRRGFFKAGERVFLLSPFIPASLSDAGNDVPARCD